MSLETSGQIEKLSQAARSNPELVVTGMIDTTHNATQEAIDWDLLDAMDDAFFGPDADAVLKDLKAGGDGNIGSWHEAIKGNDDEDLPSVEVILH